MRFVAHALQQLERSRLVTQPQRLADAGAVDFFEFLREPDDWNILQPEFLKLGTSGIELAFATINDDEVGKDFSRRDLLGWDDRLFSRFLQQPRIPPMHCLRHTRKIIL